MGQLKHGYAESGATINKIKYAYPQAPLVLEQSHEVSERTERWLERKSTPNPWQPHAARVIRAIAARGLVHKAPLFFATPGSRADLAQCTHKVV